MVDKLAYETKLCWLMGTGLVLYVIHNIRQPAFEYFPIMYAGLFFILIACIATYKYKGRLELGSKIIYIPLLVIVGSIVLQSIFTLTFGNLFYGVLLFAVYVSCRTLGKGVFIVFVPALIIQSISCIAYGVMNPGIITGGLITTPTFTGEVYNYPEYITHYVGYTANYAMAATFMVFAFTVNSYKKYWWLLTLGIVALIFTGAGDAILVLGALFLVMLFRRDWSRELVYTLAIFGVVLGVWTMLGYSGQLFERPMDKVQTITTENNIVVGVLGVQRIDSFDKAMQNIKPLGNGYQPGSHTYDTVHNVPLLILDQIGPLAALAWLFVSIYCLIKTKWKYAWSAVITLSIFEPMMWTQFAPYWWALVGVSVSSPVKDYIFRR